MSLYTMSISITEVELSALTIDEVLSTSYESLPKSEQDTALAEDRLRRWVAIGADGLESDFAQRMARKNWTRAWLLGRLAGVRRRSGVPEPGWVQRTHQVIELLINGAMNSRHDQIAFAPLLSPVIDDAAETLRLSLPFDVLQIFEPEAFEGIVDHLRLRLSNLCELPFYEVLLHWRRNVLRAAQSGDPSAREQLLSESLDPFAMHLRDVGYRVLFRDKPILFRLIAMLVEQWQASYRTFLIRLAEDRRELDQLLPKASNDVRVRRVTWGLSDPHNGGFSVLGIEFGDGNHVLYKPKDLRPDCFVMSIVTELRRLGLQKPLVLPQVLVKKEYGWTAHIQHISCAMECEVADYYRRFGAWLAVFHVLSASDMHMENFIANGADPVPVDFEMIRQGIRQRPRAVDNDTEAHWLATHILEKSVQSVGMLPAYVQGQDGTLISMGALEPSVYPVKVLRWEAINTPQMLLESATERIQINVNLPMLDGQPIDVARYRDDFLAGFTDTMRFIASHAHAVLAVVEKADLSRITVRKVIRPTRFYYMLLKRLYDHRHMDDSVVWSLEADFVARFYDWEDHAERPWKLAASERRQMLELGIPHFTMLPDSNIISDVRTPVTRLHVVLGSEVVRTRLTKLSTEVIRDQCDIVRACLQLPPMQLPANAKVIPGVPFAQALRDMLMRNSIRTERSIAWIGLTRVDHQVAAQLAPLGHDLYFGAAGIAVFLAAFAQAGCPSASEDCRQVLGATIKAVRLSKLGQLERAIGIGGAVGLGSIVYGLTLAGELLSDAQMLEAAESCAHGISPESIHGDTKFDLIAGSAGACLALLALHKRSGADWLVERAVMCGDHLLAHRDAGSGMWVSPVFTEPLTGVAHGAAGFALAFSRLYGITRHSRFSLASQDCIAFEQGHFDETLGNWIDLRSTKAKGTARAPNQWCYGAVGIGIARLSMLEDGAVSSDVLRRDIGRALAATLADKGGRNSGLCCGDAGHIEFLVDAAGKLGRPDLMAAAQTRSEELSDTWSRTGDLIWNGGWSVSNPGLFQGLAGVGFSALRSVGVNVPSPLVWA